jgi:hypothetical protein
MSAVKGCDLSQVFMWHLCRRVMHILHVLLKRDFKVEVDGYNA